MYFPIDILDNIIHIVIRNKDYFLLNKLCIVSNSIRSLIFDYITQDVIKDVLDQNYPLLFSFLLDKDMIVNDDSILFDIIEKRQTIYLMMYQKKYNLNFDDSEKYFKKFEPFYTKRMTPLYFAIKCATESTDDYYKIVKKLLNFGANPNAIYNQGKRYRYHTPLLLTLKIPYLMKLLLSYNANPNDADYDGFTILYYALLERSDIKYINLLLEYGADPTIQDYDFGSSALEIAKERGYKIHTRYFFTKNNYD